MNDNFANANVLTELQAAGGTRNGDITYATGETGEPDHADAAFPLNSVWYKFTPTTTRSFRFDTCTASYDTVLAAYTGSTVSTLTEVASNDDFCDAGSQIEFVATAGTTYYVVVDGYNDSVGTFTLTFTDFPANDDFAGAIPITPPSLPSPVNGTNVGATGEAGEPTPCRDDFPTCSATGALPLNTVWYRYDATFSGGTVQLDTCANPNFDTFSTPTRAVPSTA